MLKGLPRRISFHKYAVAKEFSLEKLMKEIAKNIAVFKDFLLCIQK